MSGSSLAQESLDQLFTKARTLHGWLPRAVESATLHKLYELMKWAPTCVNGSPIRILFLTSPESKERLLPALVGKNVEKTRDAPVTAIIAYDLKWYEMLPKLSPHFDYRNLYVNSPEFSETTAFRNSSLQGAYFILAARSLGLDVGPMSGFDLGKVNAEFFTGTDLRVNFLCNIGYGDFTTVRERAPRLDFDEACKIIS